MCDSQDEYDVYYTPPDFEASDVSQSSQSQVPKRESLGPDLQAEHKPESEPQSQQMEPPASDIDEFEIYDFSDFTAEDFARVDALAREPAPVALHIGGDVHGQSGGPRVEIEIEGSADHSVALVKASSPPPALPPVVHDPGRGGMTRSPFQQFRSWRKHLSVTDLVSPAWCELQFDYGLRQKRWLKPESRPDTFETAEGKQIAVDKGVAKKNDRVQKRGQSVHKTLEREIRPVEVLVRPTNSEERWGLRLVNMLDCLDSLMKLGCCREMPVFGLVHDEVVVGVIDELNRKPVLVSEMTTLDGHGPQKRELPSTPSKKNKRSRRTPSPSHPQLTTYFHVAVQVPDVDNNADREAVHIFRPSTPRRSSKKSTKTIVSTRPAQTYTLHISDTKTRTRDSLPPEEDTLSSRLQLMLYHRLLSSLLATSTVTRSEVNADGEGVTQPLDFEALWQRVDVVPSMPFSPEFMLQAGLLDLTDPPKPGSTVSSTGNSMRCLNDLTAAWKHAVEALAVSDVDETLTLVYRLQPSKWVAQKRRPRGPAAQQEIVLDLLAKEQEDLVRAIEASLNEAPKQYDGGDNGLARAIEQSLHEAEVSGTPPSKGKEDTLHTLGQLADVPEEGNLQHPAAANNNGTASSVSPSEGPEPNHQEGIHVKEASPSAETSLLAEEMRPAAFTRLEQEGTSRTSAPGDDEDGDEDPVPLEVTELELEARIVGSKQFALDNAMLDEYLRSILQWWHGSRPPRGVEVDKTRRCLTCEYMEGCEWRESKALELYHSSTAAAEEAILV